MIVRPRVMFGIMPKICKQCFWYHKMFILV